MITPLAVVVILFITIHSSLGGVQCQRCRSFVGPKKTIIKNHLKTVVENCAATSEECEHDMCYSLAFYNATAGFNVEVRDCLGKAGFFKKRYWKEHQITDRIKSMPGDTKSFEGFSTCDTAECNSKPLQYTPPCVHGTVIVNATAADANTTKCTSGYDTGTAHENSSSKSFVCTFFIAQIIAVMSLT